MSVISVIEKGSVIKSIDLPCTVCPGPEPGVIRRCPGKRRQRARAKRGRAGYTRDFVLLQVIEALALGPQVELTYEFNNAAGDELASLPVGGRVNVNYGKDNTLGLFLGYETQADDGPALVGRSDTVNARSRRSPSCRRPGRPARTTAWPVNRSAAPPCRPGT